jgi:hypothetical protein
MLVELLDLTFASSNRRKFGSERQIRSTSAVDLGLLEPKARKRGGAMAISDLVHDHDARSGRDPFGWLTRMTRQTRPHANRHDGALERYRKEPGDQYLVGDCSAEGVGDHHQPHPLFGSAAIRAGMSAPVCVAKGTDNIAFKIREIARAHDVPIVENVQLARVLYAS